MRSTTGLSYPVSILFISSVGWGLTWIPIKLLNGMGISGPALVFIAFLAGALVMLPFALMQHRQWRKHLSLMLLITLFGGFANVAFQTALYYGDVIRVMILFYLLPVWSVIGGKVFFGEVIDTKRVVTVVFSLGGAFLILGAMAVFEQLPHWTDLMAIGAGFAFAMNNLLFRASPGVPLTSKVTAMFVGCSLMIGGFLFVANLPGGDYGLDVTLYSALYGLVWLTLITFGTQWGVTQIEAGRAAIIIVMELVVAVLSAALYAADWLSLIEIVGGVLVVTAAIIEGGREETPEVKAA
ncbi:DMT family transporter [Thiohalophilus sp.]|uniref:DMT family transporter n=1 Tax=Thiohalophilus sp. TaxID=3028392 RepID=UPI003975E2C6